MPDEKERAYMSDTMLAFALHGAMICGEGHGRADRDLNGTDKFKGAWPRAEECGIKATNFENPSHFEAMRRAFTSGYLSAVSGS